MNDTAADHPPRRPLFLGLTLVAGVGASIVVAPGPDGLFGGLLAAVMLAIATVDARRYIIPNELTAAAVMLGLIRAVVTGEDPGLTAVAWTTLRAVATALPLLALMVAYRKLRGRNGLGLGDVKLAAVAGTWLGWVAIFAVIELAALTALGAYLVNAHIHKRPLQATAMLPFGLFLAPAIWFGWLAEALLG